MTQIQPKCVKKADKIITKIQNKISIIVSNMQVLRGHNFIKLPVSSARDSVQPDCMENSTNVIGKNSSNCIEVSERRSSNASLMMMHPVASGDNVAVTLASAHKLKVEAPPLVPCCEGKELQINEDWVHRGLSAISVKHDIMSQSQSLTRASDLLLVQPGIVKHRNSFRCLHRPELKRVPYLRRMATDELETLFKEYAAELSSQSAAKRETLEQSAGPSVASMVKNFESSSTQSKGSTSPRYTMEGTNLNQVAQSMDELPQGKRLHCVRARIYTSVLAGAKAGDQLENVSINDGDFDHPPAIDPIPEDEIPIYEELQIILPPKYDDVASASMRTCFDQ